MALVMHCDGHVPSLAGRRAGTLAGTLCVLIVAVFYLLTIRQGHDWGDDFSQYIQHAVNVAHGTSYTETRYLYNPDNPSIGPRQYPPGFPVALAPVVRAFGLDLQPMKAEEVLFFVAALLLIHRLIQPLMPPAASAAVVLAVGLNPYFWDFKDQILSDLPFLFFFFATLLCVTRAHEMERSARLRHVLSALGGVAMYASYATRVIGIVLLPTLVISDFIQHRWLTKETRLAIGTFTVLAALQYVLLTRDTSYTDLLAISSSLILANVMSYAGWLADIWANGYASLPQKLLFLATVALALIGYVSLWRQPRATLFAVAPLFYLMVIAVWPLVQGTRFLIPVIPIFIACTVLGALSIDRAIARHWRKSNLVLSVLFALVSVTYIARYSTLPFGRLQEGIGKPESVQLFDFVRTSTRRDDVIVFSRPRALSLFGERTVTPPSRSADPCELWRYIRQVRAGYLVTGPGAANDEAKFLATFVRDFAPNLREVMRNADVAVYRVDSAPATCVELQRVNR
jgi:dolichyl-phosphate-mannose-protein mannosyltransferase